MSNIWLKQELKFILWDVSVKQELSFTMKTIWNHRLVTKTEATVKVTLCKCLGEKKKLKLHSETIVIYLSFRSPMYFCCLLFWTFRALLSIAPVSISFLKSKTSNMRPIVSTGTWAVQWHWTMWHFYRDRCHSEIIH